MNKKAFELSINFIVILIISIVIFGFGIKFVYDLMYKAGELSNMTQKQIDAQIENILCDSSERICIGTSTKEIRPNKVGVFTIGILNTGDESEFYIDIRESESDGIPYIGGTYWMLQNKVTIKPNEQKKVGIAVQVPGGTKKGTYVLNVYVCKDVSSCDKDSPSNVRYGTTQKLYVVVP